MSNDSIKQDQSADDAHVNAGNGGSGAGVESAEGEGAVVGSNGQNVRVVSKSRDWIEPFVGVSLVLCLAGLLIAFVGLLLHSVYFSAEEITELKAVLDVPLPDKMEGVIGYRLDQIEKRIESAVSIYGAMGAFFSTFVTVLIIYFSMTSRSSIDKEFRLTKDSIYNDLESEFGDKLEKDILTLGKRVVKKVEERFGGRLDKLEGYVGSDGKNITDIVGRVGKLEGYVGSDGKNIADIVSRVNSLQDAINRYIPIPGKINVDGFKDSSSEVSTAFKDNYGVAGGVDGKGKK